MLARPYNAGISNEDNTAIDGGFTTAEQKLPWMVALTAAQRRRMRKLGMKTDGFARRALDLGKLNAGVVPRDLSLVQLETDIATRDTLKAKIGRVERLLQLMQDTATQMGADIFESTRTIYNCMQRSGAPEGMEAALEELGQVFKRKKKAKTTTPPTGGTGTGTGAGAGATGVTGGTAGA